MFQCPVCGNATAKPGFVSEVFVVEDRHLLEEHIPAQVCLRCGEPAFLRETTEMIRQLVHGSACPSKTVPLDVFSLA